ncbi:MAG TPA: hypothetical protein VFQ24_04790 [Terriglobia bacterium]|nr:hypothetical protein [Terriglobia bacterium]
MDEAITIFTFGVWRGVSVDERFMAFQMARVGDPAGVGRGIFVYDFSKAPASGK